MAEVQNRHNDFVLFPQREPPLQGLPDSRWRDVFDDFHFSMAANYQHDFSSVTASGYEGIIPTYSSGSLYYDGPQLVIDEPKESFRPTSASPSSMTHSLEHVPSSLSHTSGASGRSTASSAVGSPFSHTTQSLPAGQDQWIESSHGLGIAAGINHDTFPSYHLSSVQNEHIVYHEKYPGSFVGELQQIPLPFTALSPLISSPISCSSSTSQSISSPLCSPSVRFSTTMGTLSTIDTILERAKSHMQPLPQGASPLLPKSPSVMSIPLNLSISGQGGPGFRPPARPASAIHENVSRATSPLRTHKPDDKSHGLHWVSGSTSSRTSTEHPNKLIKSSTPPDYTCGNRYFQNPFFTQSSGRFVAPLESSCWFSSCHLFVFRVADLYLNHLKSIFEPNTNKGHDRSHFTHVF